MRAELSFIWGKMRTIAWETAFQIALRNCSKEVGGRSVYMWFWERGSTCNQAHIFAAMKECGAFLDMKRCKNWAYKSISWKYVTIWRPVLPVFWNTECFIPDLHPELPAGVVEDQQPWQQVWFNPCKDTWRAPLASASLSLMPQNTKWKC